MMRIDNPPPLANEWGTTWDDEIRQIRDEWIAMRKKWGEAQREKLDIENRMFPLMSRAHNEGWSLALSNILYGRDYRNPAPRGRIF